MFIKTISAEYSRKFNLGNYEAVDISVQMWADIEEGEDPIAAASELRAHCRLQVKDEIMSLKTKQQEAKPGAVDIPSKLVVKAAEAVLKELSVDDVDKLYGTEGQQEQAIAEVASKIAETAVKALLDASQGF